MIRVKMHDLVLKRKHGNEVAYIAHGLPNLDQNFDDYLWRPLRGLRSCLKQRTGRCDHQLETFNPAFLSKGRHQHLVWIEYQILGQGQAELVVGSIADCDFSDKDITREIFLPMGWCREVIQLADYLVVGFDASGRFVTSQGEEGVVVDRPPLNLAA